MNLGKDLTPEGWHAGECASTRMRRSAASGRFTGRLPGVGKRRSRLLEGARSKQRSPRTTFALRAAARPRIEQGRAIAKRRRRCDPTGWWNLLCKLATPALLTGLPGIALADELPIRSVQNIFTPKSGPAETLFWLEVLVLSICAVIFLVVAGLLTYAIIRYRRRGPGDDDSEPPQVYGGAAIELAWTVMPILIIVVLVLVTARTIGEITRPQPGGKDNEELRIIGHRFWWEVRYPKHNVLTANEIHVPVDSRDQPGLTEITLESADVAHGFWVPDLNGKLWAVPNYRNVIWIKPFEPAVYLGNCTVLCGDQHANMLIRVFVQDRKDYDQWLADQQKPPVADPAVAQGLKEFVANSCGTCHTIATTAANGVFGPDLTHFMSRKTLGAGVAANNEENLRSWLRDPQVLKPGCLMPNMKLDDKQVDEILAYLRTLK